MLERQLDFALANQCETVVCLSETLHPELISLQQKAERAGVRFQTIRDFRPLSGLVSSADELLVIADGLAFDSQLAQEILVGRRKVVILPAETAVPEGFERLDRDVAWGGLMLASGALVEQLAQMPTDIDPQSSLLRLALQSGTKTAPLPDHAIADHQWILVQEQGKLQEFEKRWLGNAAQPASFVAPVTAAADRAALTVLKRHDRPISAARAVGGLGYALLALALVSGYFGFPIAGFVAAALAAFAARFSLTISAILRGSGDQTKGGKILAKLPPAVLDLVLMVLVIQTVEPAAQTAALFAVLMLFGLLRLGVVSTAPSRPGKWRELLEDRGVLSGILGVGLAFGQLTVVIQLLAAFLLIALLVQSYSVKLTGD
ncbi:hypothetical protein [Pontixanthobacter aquaemixtae]|uniref:Uncharacterized protein n=1 Tax=Pontixanthobacter aquaemixtae TaxID=1958940 RepID=A0A844ZPQ2_9SPHN|nr:hypothetical protein [Pontixanthobacter aquaemixtae]MXO90331.1 hypothetical protein [Pontixanthobacter aquaemixtae]